MGFNSGFKGLNARNTDFWTLSEKVVTICFLLHVMPFYVWREGRIFPVNAIKANEGEQIWLIWFLNSALGLGECLASRPGLCISGKGPAVTIGRESGCTPERSRRCEEDNILLLLGFEPRILFRPARSLVTAWTQHFQVLSLFVTSIF